MSSSQFQEAPAISTGRFKPGVILRRYAVLSTVLILLGTAVAVPLFFWKLSFTYTAIASVIVSPKFVNNLITDRTLDLNSSEYVLFTEQQTRLITNSQILRQVLSIPEVKAKWVQPDETLEVAAERLRTSMTVDSKPRTTSFVTVSLNSDNPNGLDVVLNAVMRAYLKEAQSSTFFESNERIQWLKQRRDELLDYVPKLRNLRMNIGNELGVTTFKEDSLNPYDNILIQSTSAAIEAQRHRVEAEALLYSLQTKEGMKGKTTVDSLAYDIVNADPLLKEFKSTLIKRRSELTTQILTLTPEHPARKKTEQEIAKIDHDLQAAEDKMWDETRKALVNQYQAKLDQAQQVEKALTQQVEVQRQQATHYATRYNEALTYTRDIERAYKQLEVINDRVDFLSIESEAPGFVRLYTEAKRPLQPSGSNGLKLGVVLIAGVLGMGLGLPVLLDMMDKRLRTPAEIQKILGFAPLAWILERNSKSAQQFAVDQLRRLALTLDRDRRQHGNRYFTLTSVKPGGGTTTLTLELAKILNELGVRTLAVEINAFKPDARYLGIDPNKGLSNLLNQSISEAPEHLIVAATLELPERLPVGLTNTRHLVTFGRLPALLERLGERYELILLDAPPVLLSADTELFAEITHGILLIVEAERVVSGELKRATHLIERLSPPVVATVMNRVRVYRGGGYFSQLLQEYSTASKLRMSWLKRLLWG
jgi:Mrp family chromosome partitioning ATPase/uncharacterized protein involved in exopolysaccharide biosynthesis